MSFFLNFDFKFSKQLTEPSKHGIYFFVLFIHAGGKDSTVLAHTMCLLNKRYDYGLKLVLLSIDEGISGEPSTSALV